MKLKIEPEKDIQVITVTESVNERDLQVLKAGLSNLLKNGKNRLLLHFAVASDLPNELLRDLSQLEVVARELSGRILLSGITSSVRKKIENFAQPPIITSFETKQEAMQAFAAGGRKVDEKTPVPTAPGQPHAPHAPASTAASAGVPLQLTKEEIKKREEALLGKLRADLARYEVENKELKKQLLHLAFNRVEPPDEQAYKTRIESLETELQAALEKARDPGKNPAGGAPARK